MRDPARKASYSLSQGLGGLGGATDPPPADGHAPSHTSAHECSGGMYVAYLPGGKNTVDYELFKRLRKGLGG